MNPIEIRTSMGSLFLVPHPKYAGRFLLVPRGEFTPEEESVLDQVLFLVGDYEYSPGHGNVGFLLAEQVAEIVGGEAILPEVEPLREGEIP